MYVIFYLDNESEFTFLVEIVFYVFIINYRYLYLHYHHYYYIILLHLFINMEECFILDIELSTNLHIHSVQGIIYINIREQELNQDTCAICLEQFTSNSQVKKLPCRHIFHPECVDQWLIRSVGECPVCKRNVLSTEEQETAQTHLNQTDSHSERYLLIV